MLHYKAFTSAATNGDVMELEKLVNSWLEETQPIVHTMTQSPAGAYLVISFLYELEEDEHESAVVATAEAIVADTVTASPITTADTLMVTLLPQMELPY